MSQNIHGTVVALYLRSQWRGVLIRGHSGAGKSDLALRLMTRGARLVVDDQALVWCSQNQAYASAPRTISGQMEIRGVGILPFLSHPLARLRLVVDASHEEPERLPDQQFTQIAGVAVPTLSLKLTHPSAAHVVAAALESL